MTSRAFEVRIVGDVKDAKRALESMDTKTSKFGKSMANVGKLMVAAFATQKVLEFGKAAVDRAEAMQSAYAATAKILQNTGGAAGVTADEVKKMNRELAFKTGFDKELITTGTNILLTFKSIRNEVGEGNDIFTRANTLALDMSATFKTDLKSSATQLGKALEDPVKGVGALARVGVTFTNEQKELIASLQESGDLLGAQQIVLEALEGQVGGVATETADASAIISNGWKEVQEIVGGWLLPILAELSEFVTGTLLPGFVMLTEWISEKWTAITAMFQGGNSEQISKFKEWAAQIWEIVKGLIEMVTAIVDRMVRVASALWDRFGDKILIVMRGVWGYVSDYIDLIIGVLKGLIDFVTAVFQGRWGDAFDAIKDIVGSFFEFFASFPGRIVEILSGAVGIVGRAALDVGKAIINGIIGFWNKLDPRITIGPLPSWIPGIGGKQWQSPDMFPDIPKFADGGIATQATLGVFGEAGPEALIPLDRFPMTGGNNYSITVEAGVGDPVAIGQQIVDAITEFERSSGDGWRAAATTGV